MSRIPQYKPGQLEEKSNFNKEANDFFIEPITSQKNKVKTPTIPHRKTVNDLVFISKGMLEKIVCSDLVTIQQGTILFLPHYKIRTYINYSEKIEGFYCHFSDEFIANGSGLKQLQDIYNYTNSQNNPLLCLDEPHQHRVSVLLQQLYTVYHNEKDFNLIKLYLFTLFGEISHFIENLPKRIVSQNETLTLRFRKLITEHIHSIHGIQEYAQLLHVSPNHLNKSVKNTTGKTASDIINEALLMEAKALLSLPDLTVSDIAFSLGIEDISYFSRFFKKHAKQTPTEYRKMIDLSQ